MKKIREAKLHAIHPFPAGSFAVLIGDHLRFGIICGLFWGSFPVSGSFCGAVQAPSTLIRFQTHTAIVHATTPKTITENGAIRKRSLVWTEKTMLSENGVFIKIDTTGRKTTRPWVSKMLDRRYHVAAISHQFRGPIYWNAHASSSFEHAHWGYKGVFKTDRRCSVDGTLVFLNMNYTLHLKVMYFSSGIVYCFMKRKSWQSWNWVFVFERYIQAFKNRSKVFSSW